MSEEIPFHEIGRAKPKKSKRTPRQTLETYIIRRGDDTTATNPISWREAMNALDALWTQLTPVEQRLAEIEARYLAEVEASNARKAGLNYIDEDKLARALTKVQGGRYESWLGRTPLIAKAYREDDPTIVTDPVSGRRFIDYTKKKTRKHHTLLMAKHWDDDACPEYEVEE